MLLLAYTPFIDNLRRYNRYVFMTGLQFVHRSPRGIEKSAEDDSVQIKESLNEARDRKKFDAAIS